ncbi:SDR family NAD(P)-dependent oxidoreductase [Streptomyces sp. OE57]|uniref:SDR family NAD(P)-dependent oxidoreductase n=1 Tax=Streptomyces lacaronensis TaxID=3379885 RepID=UPI0039B77F8F
MCKVWFVTGSSRGFGRQFVETALARGDKVAATARNTESLADLRTAHDVALLPLTLDVTDRAAVFESVKRAKEHFGRLDVIVNNAGYGLFGAVEELSEQDIRDQLEANLFGSLWVTQAALPYLRQQRFGHILQISSIGGIVAFPGLGGYHASKWALEGITESLAQEVAGFGIKVTLVEPGAFSTDWAGSSAARAKPISAYEEIRKVLAAASRVSEQGDPARVGPALLKIVDAENPPLRVFFGPAPHQTAKRAYSERLKTWAAWADPTASSNNTEADCTSQHDTI